MAKNHCEAKFEPELKHTERTRAVAGKREKNGVAKANRERTPKTADVPEVERRTTDTHWHERGQRSKVLSTW